MKLAYALLVIPACLLALALAGDNSAAAEMIGRDAAALLGDESVSAVLTAGAAVVGMALVGRTREG